ncbi:hypothetical protein F5B19DRAFT_460373 [Rostrohypoxylon terebratum]|nr:hypothetical protein F5B19DRAFT_460373 [Rostrohypoxylon terebratum]
MLLLPPQVILYLVILPYCNTKYSIPPQCLPSWSFKQQTYIDYYYCYYYLPTVIPSVSEIDRYFSSSMLPSSHPTTYGMTPTLRVLGLAGTDPGYAKTFPSPQLRIILNFLNLLIPTSA